MTLSSNSLNFRFRCLFFLCMLITPAFDYTISGNTLTDLVSTTLASEVSYWTLSSYVTSGVKIYQCGSTYILGGYNILAGSGSTYEGQYFETQYTGLPSHNQINLSIKIYALDSWDAISAVDDHFTVSFDGRELYGWAIYGYLGTYTSALCGNSGYPDYPPFTMKITVPHIDSAVTLRITSYLDENSINESIGFRDITMTFVYQEEPEVTICGVSSQPLPDKACPCDYTNQYMSPVQSGTCVNCDSTCATCTSSAITACLSCPAGNTYFKDFQCLTCDSTCATCSGAGANRCTTCIANYNMVSNTCYPASDCTSPLYTSESGGINYCNTPCPGSYAYWDGSCSTVCPLPRIVTIVDSFSLCTYPCTSTQYLYWNGTCSSTCDSPYEVVVSKTKNFCVWPCASGQYAYWDNTCDSTCAPPLVKYSEGSPNVKNFCAYPCQLYEYLYWNGTCSDTCDAPLVASTKHGRQFCTYPCLLTDFLYFNGSCLNSCPSPLSIRVVDARSYCDYGCIDELEYLYWNGSCGSCPSPLIQKIDAGKKFCVFQCDPTEFLYWDGSCQSTCSPPLTQDPEGSPMTRYYCNFPCDEDEFLYWNGTCSSTCPDPLTSSTANSRKFCNYPCASTEYLYWDGTCSSTCPSPYEGRFEGRPTRNYCDYPCEGTDSLYWNGTCTTCSSPLTSRVTSGKNYCDYPCLTTEYLYWEGSCNSTCASPLVQDVQGDSVTRNFCQFPCAESEYMYWNGTCSSKCPYPLEAGSEYGRLICNYPCPVSEYLYYNGTCGTSCSLPLSERMESSRNYCDYPCKSYEYLAWDGTCLDFCDSPYVTTTYDGYQFCNLPCYADYYYFPYTHSCNASCDSPYTNNTDLVYLRCYPAEDLDYADGLLEAPANPGTVTFVTLVKLMQYVRYLDIDFPPRFQRFQVSRGRPVLSTNFGIQLDDSARVPFERHPSVIETYTKNNLRASFLVNFWNDLTTILIFVLAGIVVAIFEKVLKRIHFETFALILERFRVILKWNFPLMLLACFIDDVILFSALEFMTLANRSESVSASAVSFAFSAVFVVFEIVLMLFIIYTVRLSRSLHPKGEGMVPIRLQGFQVLYRGFKTDSFLNQYFFLIYMSRIGLSMIVAVCCESMPLLGIFFQVSFSMIILAYLVVMRPFVKKVNQYQLVLYEFGVFLLNICVGLLTVIGVSNSSFPTASNYLVNIVIGGNDALNIMLLVFLVIKLYLESASISEANKKHGVKGMRRVIAYLQLLSLPLQQGNMGFEEMIDYEIYSNKKSWTRAVTPIKAANYVNMKEMALHGGSPLSTANLYSIDKLDSPESRRGLTGKGMMMDVSALSNGDQRTRILDESTVGEIRLIKQTSAADPMGSLIDLNSPQKNKYFNANDEEQLYKELYQGGLLTNSPPQKPLKPIRRSPSQSRLRLLRQSSAAEPMGSFVDLSSLPIQRSPGNPHGEEFFNPFVSRGEPMSMAQDFDDQWYRENGSIYQGLAPSRLLYNGSPNRSSVANEVRLLRQSPAADQTGYSIDLGSPGKNKNEQFFNSQFNNRDSPNMELEEDELWYTEKDQNPDETLSRSIYANTSIRFRDRVKKKLTKRPTRTYNNAEKYGTYLNY